MSLINKRFIRVTDIIIVDETPNVVIFQDIDDGSVNQIMDKEYLTSNFQEVVKNSTDAELTVQTTKTQNK